MCQANFTDMNVVLKRLNHIKLTFQILPPGHAVKAAFQAQTVRTAQVHLRHRMAVGNRSSFVIYSSKYIKR